MKTKRIMALIFSMAIIGSLVICSTQTKAHKDSDDTYFKYSDPKYIENITGAWEINQGEFYLDKNKAAKNAFENATEKLLGADYEVIAYLGKQVVSGSNYVFLCRITPTVPEAEWLHVLQ